MGKSETDLEGRVLDLLVKISGTTERMVERVDQMREKQEESGRRIDQLRDGQERNDRKIEKIQQDVTAIRTTLKRKGIVNGDSSGAGVVEAESLPGAPQEVVADQVVAGQVVADRVVAEQVVADQVVGALVRQFVVAHARKILVVAAGLLGLLAAVASRFKVDGEKLGRIWDLIVR